MAKELNQVARTGRTMLDLFTPPDGYEGDTCVIVGFCADAVFLEEAMLQFTGKVAAARACNACLQGLVFLDPRQTPDLTIQVPGLARVAAKASEWKGRKGLLHAKLLWLVFRHPDSKDVRIRLVVSTGNWTRSGAANLIDLVWMTEFDRPRFEVGESVPPLALPAAADCRAGAAFIRRVAALFGVEVVAEFSTLLERSIGAVVPERIVLPRTRLIDSFDASLASQIEKRLAGHSFNFSLAGSGFFEKPVRLADGTSGKPAVLTWMESMTEANSAWKNVLIVNPFAAGAVAAWRNEAKGDLARWTIHAAGTGLSTESRSLHAKFILLSKVAQRKPLLKGAVYAGSVLYLGSGNLSKQGFLQEWRDMGNIELGVLLDLPAELTSAELQRRLPIGAALDGGTKLEADTDEFEAIDIPPMPAIAALRQEADRGWKIEWSDHPQATRVRLGDQEFVVSADDAYLADANGINVTTAAAWAGSESDGAWVGIPVIDQAGGLCRQPFRAMHFDDLLANLVDWKTIENGSEDDGDEEGSQDQVPQPEPKQPKPRAARARPSGDRDRFPVSQASLLIENIAQVHDKLELGELSTWLRRLEALLTEAIDPELMDAWRNLHVDFLACLAEPEFKPACLCLFGNELPTAEQQAFWQAYEDLLARVHTAWKLNNEERSDES